MSNSGADNYDKESFDKPLLAHALLPRGEEFEYGTDIGRYHDQDGTPACHRSANPLLNTKTDKIEFQDGFIQEYLANTIAENMYSQIETEGNDFILLQEFFVLNIKKVVQNAQHKRTAQGSTVCTIEGQIYLLDTVE